MGYVACISVNIGNKLAEWWQCFTVAAIIGKHLALDKSILQRCGGSGGVRIEWGMW